MEWNWIEYQKVTQKGSDREHRTDLNQGHEKTSTERTRTKEKEEK